MPRCAFSNKSFNKFKWLPAIMLITLKAVIHMPLSKRLSSDSAQIESDLSRHIAVIYICEVNRDRMDSARFHKPKANSDLVDRYYN